MKKSQAIQIARDQFGVFATNQNAHFSKVNAAKDVWWIEVSMSKIASIKVPRIYFLLQRGSSISLLDIPTDFLRNNVSSFRIRADKNCMCFEIDIVTYKNVIGPKRVDMSKFLVTP